MKQKSPLTHFFRSGILLAALLAVPGIAICWNLVPQNWQQQNLSPEETHIAPLSSCVFEEEVQEKTETTQEPPKSPTEVLPEANAVLPVAPVLETVAAAPTEIPPPSSFTQEETVLPAGFAKTHPKMAAEYTGEYTESHTGGYTEEHTREYTTASEPLASIAGAARTVQQDLPQLEKKLKELGTQYYRLEKWGSKGELFRFSCYVSPSESHPYQKCFQAIDSEPLYVVESVIEEIIQWKSSVPSSF